MVTRGMAAIASSASRKWAPTERASSGPPNSEMSAPAAKMRSPPVTTTAPGGSRVSSAAASLGQQSLRLQEGAVVRDRGPQLGRALARRRDSAQDRRPPLAHVGVEVEREVEVALQLLHARAVGLVDDEEIGDLEQTRLHGLH